MTEKNHLARGLTALLMLPVWALFMVVLGLIARATAFLFGLGWSLFG